MKKENSLLKDLVLVVGAVASVASIAYGVYRFFIKDDLDEFDEDIYFEDEDIADLLEDED